MGGRKKNIEEMSIAEQQKAAMDKILRTVNLSETSSYKMRQKLVDKGFDDAVIEYAISKAIEYSLIDDIRYANCLVSSALSAGKGLAKVQHELGLLGIELDSLESYQEYLESEEPSQLEMAIAILKQHPPKAKDKRSAAYRKLISKGYSMEISSSAAKAWYEEYASL